MPVKCGWCGWVFPSANYSFTYTYSWMALSSFWGYIL
jgi:hypothetical protein